MRAPGKAGIRIAVVILILLWAPLFAAGGASWEGLRLDSLKTGLDEGRLVKLLGEPADKESGLARLESRTADITGFFDALTVEEAWAWSDGGGAKAKYTAYVFLRGNKAAGVLVDFYKAGESCAPLPEVRELIGHLGINRVPDGVKKHDAVWTFFTWYRSGAVVRLFATGSAEALFGRGTVEEDLAVEKFRLFRVKSLMIRDETAEDSEGCSEEEGPVISREVVALRSAHGHVGWTYEAAPPSTPSLSEYNTWGTEFAELLREAGQGTARVRLTVPASGGSPALVEILWIQFDDQRRSTVESRRKMALLIYRLAQESRWEPARARGRPVHGTIEINISVK